MADINITQLTSYADPKSTDELPIVDLVADVTKRVTLAKLLQNANPGTAAAPGITFDGRAANTGIYSQNDYHIGLATNGVSRVHCRENGYVGINKEAPTAPFDVVGNSVITGTLSVTEATSVGGNLTVIGDLTVNGTTTTVNSTTLTVDDKNIELGSVAAPTNTTADGGGITLRGSTNKTWNWINSTSSWTSSEHINLASGKTYRINGVEVLSATALASAVKITSANITDGTIVNADISASAEIAVSKLADGLARQVLQTDAAGTGVEWTSNLDLPGTLDVTGNVTFDSNLTIAGDLTVNGTTTTINTQDLLVEDKNIIIGNVDTPSDVTADSGGITLKGTTDKTINWVDATDSWTSSEHVDLASGKSYRINGTEVLSATALGSAVQISSANIPNGTIVDADVNASAEIAVSKLADGDARQLLQTDAAGTGVEWTSNVDVPGTLDVTGAATLDSTLTVPAGSEAAPTVRFTGDTNTGIYSPGADQVAISTNGTQRISIGSDGDINIDSGGVFYDASTNRLAIGTTSPASTLDVNGDVTITDKIIHGGDTNTAIRFPANDTVSIETAGTERMRITNNGLILGNNSSIFATGRLAATGFATGYVDLHLYAGSQPSGTGGYNFYQSIGQGIYQVAAFGGPEYSNTGPGWAVGYAVFSVDYDNTVTIISSNIRKSGDAGMSASFTASSNYLVWRTGNQAYQNYPRLFFNRIGAYV